MRTLLYAWEQTNQQVMTLEPMLRAAFGRLNRDWRRVAITEAAFNRANGQLAALALGTRVEWSAAADACPKCRALHGRSFLVVDPNDPDKDPMEHVWVGKNPVGSRPPEAIPSIPLHPHCRCLWRPLLKLPPVTSEAMLAAIQELRRRTLQP